MKKSPVMLRVTMVVMAALVGVLAAAVTTARPAFASRRHVQHHVSTTASAMPPIKVSTTTKEYLEALGMPYEEHGVQTDDGYILTVFRIPQLDPSGKPRSDSRCSPLLTPFHLNVFPSPSCLSPQPCFNPSLDPPNLTAACPPLQANPSSSNTGSSLPAGAG